MTQKSLVRFLLLSVFLFIWLWNLDIKARESLRDVVLTKVVKNTMDCQMNKWFNKDWTEYYEKCSLLAIMRRRDDSLEKLILLETVDGNIPKGRTQRRWIDQITAITSRLCKTSCVRQRSVIDGGNGKVSIILRSRCSVMNETTRERRVKMSRMYKSPVKWKKLFVICCL